MPFFLGWSSGAAFPSAFVGSVAVAARRVTGASGLAVAGLAARVIAALAAPGLAFFAAADSRVAAGLVAADLAADAAVVARGFAAGLAAAPPLAAEAAVDGLAWVATTAGSVAGFGLAADFVAVVFTFAALDFGAAFGLEAAEADFGLDGALAMISPTPEMMDGPAGPVRIAMIAVFGR